MFLELSFAVRGAKEPVSLALTGSMNSWVSRSSHALSLEGLHPLQMQQALNRRWLEINGLDDSAAAARLGHLHIAPLPISKIAFDLQSTPRLR